MNNMGPMFLAIFICWYKFLQGFADGASNCSIGFAILLAVPYLHLDAMALCAGSRSKFTDLLRFGLHVSGPSQATAQEGDATYEPEQEKIQVGQAKVVSRAGRGRGRGRGRQATKIGD